MIKKTKPESDSPWESTREKHLKRYKPSGVYFAKFKAGGKQFRFSLKTTVFTVAQVRLAARRKEKKKDAVPTTTLGKLLVKNAADLYRHDFESNTRLKPRTRQYYGQVVERLWRSWPGLAEADAAKITETDCREWGMQNAKLAPVQFNNMLMALRNIFKAAINQGHRHSNPALVVKRMRPRSKKLTLPTKKQFTEFVEAIDKARGWCSHDCADFVAGLAFTGMRRGEAAMVELQDLDFAKDIITIRGDAITGTKNWSIRRVPLIPQARELFLRMKDEREDEPKTARLFKVNEAQKAMNRAAEKVGMERIVHHDLRHFFATICIESGVDIPTVSRWLGHKDGGALLMKTYGHLRDEHSSEQAQKVSFK